MILTGSAIRGAIERGDIEIDPYVPEHVNPNSVDLTLGDEVGEYKTMSQARVGGDRLPNVYYHDDTELVSFLDAKREYVLERSWIQREGLILLPGRLYLMHTVERVRSREFVPIMDGKSSTARLGVSVHLTAGFGDIDFDGQYTMEVTCVLPVRLYAGMRIAQMRFHRVEGPIEFYRGNYVGEAARGPVASRSWRQFK